MNNGIILFGGSFDPVHTGHITVARSALKKLEACELIFIPARRSPHKKNTPDATGEQRKQMLELAISDYPELKVSDIELDRPAPSYTFDTVKHFKENAPYETKIYWLIGADSVSELAKWYKVNELFEICTICVMNRGGIEEPDYDKFAAESSFEMADKLRRNAVKTPKINISSTEIRHKAAAGQSISGMVPREVESYIINKGLYKDSGISV